MAARRARYPLGDEGLRAAQQHFAALEPSAVYVNLAAGTPLTGRARSRWSGVGLVVAALLGAGIASVLVLRSASDGSHAVASPVTSTTTIAAAPPGGGWLSSSTTEVDYLQWTTQGGALQGDLTKVQITGKVPNQRSSLTTQPVTGSVDSRQVTLSVDGSAALYGSLSGTGLAVNWPSSNGTVLAQVFEPVTPGGYDQAVQALLQQAIGANSAGASTQCATASCLPVPPVPQGYEQIGDISSSGGSKHKRIHFAARPLELCFAVGDPSIQRLTYEIGSSWFFGGPTTMFDSSGGNSVTNGCVADPGNDSGGENVSIHADGPGGFTVAIYQALS